MGCVGLAVVLGELLPLSALMMSPKISPTTEKTIFIFALPTEKGAIAKPPQDVVVVGRPRHFQGLLGRRERGPSHPAEALPSRFFRIFEIRHCFT